jgi:(5-formylfuran-3-yl)methyl phosphate synthase
VSAPESALAARQQPIAAVDDAASVVTARRVRVLVSVRDDVEARIAADAGTDFIDLKDPARGALGGLEPAAVARIVRALRGPCGYTGRISATVGDWPASSLQALLERVKIVADSGVDDVKVGIEAGTHARAWIEALARARARVVPVLIADQGVDDERVDAAFGARAFGAVMLDTAIKQGGSLVQRLPHDTLRRFVDHARAVGALAGLAGALRMDDAPTLKALSPDFAGFRSAVCDGHRATALVPVRLRSLIQTFA